jgi:hypothetical protein
MGGRNNPRTQVAKEIKGDVRAAKKLRLPWWGVLAEVICCLSVFWWFDHFGRLELGIPTLMGVCALSLVVIVKRDLIRCAWFWITMAIVAALHVLLILYVPWPTKGIRGLMIGGAAFVDMCVIFAVVAVVERFVQGTDASTG